MTLNPVKISRYLRLKHHLKMDVEQCELLVKSYTTGSKELQIQHLMNWQEKELAKKFGKIHFGSFGSRLTAWDQPHNIKWRQKVYQENKKN